MKRLFSFLSLLFFYIIGYAQAWVWDEIAQDAKESDPISFSDLLYVLIVFFIFFVFYLWYKYLKSLNKAKFKKNLTIAFVSIVFLGFIMFSSIFMFYDSKRSNNYENAINSFKQICTNVDAYVSVNDIDMNITVLKEIREENFEVPNSIDDKWVNRLIKEPKDNTICRCFELGELSPSINVAFAKKYNQNLSSYESPFLYSCIIKPFRIKYYSNYINLRKDISEAFQLYVDYFFSNNNCEIYDGHIIDFATEKLNNKYFRIEATSNEVKQWKDNLVNMYLCDYPYEHVYKYEIINYGHFEIMYCIIRPAKLGITEKLVVKNGNLMEQSNIFDIERNSSLYRFFVLYCIALLLTIFTFLIAKKKNKSV